ncbi:MULTISPECIES: ABC transporter permease [Stenotrophomonas]|uniref:ABC transporter permease n=1 Tax=Stenotrophomonas nitritireducens TaxID=83617 RepID=A0ABR5NMB4_9GAMM|nr:MULTISPECIES: FtsX-like permease family protein [Stenotrophomonas]KQN97260.1 ABC transporter permease [Stenotrophomonas sp. Leaf70]KRG59277.1 ABC transporter permease [Stenotrophomonas nitritireducens]
MEIRPILSVLMRHKTAAALIVLEIALSCAIICNAIFVIGHRTGEMRRDSGIAEDELVYISVSSLQPDRNRDAMRREDTATLAAVPGVRSVTSVNQLPYGDNVWASGINLRPGQAESIVTASNYMDDGRLLPTLGLRIAEGRGFNPDEYQSQDALEAAGPTPQVPSVLLSRSLAARLFPGRSALGQDIYVWGDKPSRVVGVVDRLIAPGRGRTFEDSFHTMIFPLWTSNGDYVLRTDPERRGEVLKAAVAALNRTDPNRIIDTQSTVSEMRRDFYSRDRAVIWLLVSVCVALLAVTAFGIVGLASFWVQQRTRQIGIRRALGATRAQILRYFQAENFVLTSTGIVLGVLLAYTLNLTLMRQYELPRLPLVYIPASALLLWLLGQAAVLGPARRAASIPPAVATRSA